MQKATDHQYLHVAIDSERLARARKRFNKGNNRAATWLSTLDAEQ
jgi:hypothetical protein